MGFALNSSFCGGLGDTITSRPSFQTILHEHYVAE